MDEHFSCHMEQGDGESHTLPHEEHHNQEDYLEGETEISERMEFFSTELVYLMYFVK